MTLASMKVYLMPFHDNQTAEMMKQGYSWTKYRAQTRTEKRAKQRK